MMAAPKREAIEECYDAPMAMREAKDESDEDDSIQKPTDKYT